MKLVSIVGDSVSTYEGYNPPGYAVYYDEQKISLNGMTSVYDTWWAKVNQALKANLCVNNSYSGSRVSGLEFPAATSRMRLMNLHFGQYMPNIILVNMGYNDFGYGVKISKGKWHSLRKKDLMYFEDAYHFLLEELNMIYPEAEIVCGTLMRTKMVGNIRWIFPETFGGVPFDQYNDVIRKACKKQKCHLADINRLNICYETLDGSHPTINGHLTIADAWVEALRDIGML